MLCDVSIELIKDGTGSGTYIHISTVGNTIPYISGKTLMKEHAVS